jgi:hypothetical protein
MFEQERVIVRLQQRVLAEPAIVACFLGGSYGRRQDDAYSDLDVALVFGDAAERAAAYSRRQEFVRSVLPYVPVRSFDAEHVRPFFHIALFANGAKVDYRYESVTELTPNAADRDIRLLKDSDGWGARFQAASAQAAPTETLGRITAVELAELDTRFWIMYWDAYRLLLRGDADKPFTIYVQLVAVTLPRLVGLLPAGDPARSGLQRLAYSADTRATAGGMRQLLDAYVTARSAVARRHNLPLARGDAFEESLRRLVEKSAR